MKYFAIIIFSGGQFFWFGVSNPVGFPAAGPKKLVPIPEASLADTIENIRRLLTPEDCISVIELDLSTVGS